MQSYSTILANHVTPMTQSITPLQTLMQSYTGSTPDLPREEEQAILCSLSSTERDTLSLLLLEQTRPITDKGARVYHLDPDDLSQDAWIEIRKLLDGDLSRYHNLRHLVCIRIRDMVLNKLRYEKYRRHTSLDAPLSEDSDACLYDYIADECACSPSEDEATQRLLSTALGQLSSRRRQAIETHYGLAGSGYHTYHEMAEALGTTEKRAVGRLTSGLARLRADNTLREACGLELLPESESPHKEQPHREGTSLERVQQAYQELVRTGERISARTVAALAGLSRSHAASCLNILMEQGTIPSRFPDKEAPVPPEIAYAKELAAWNAGHQSVRRLASALQISPDRAYACMRAMREAGLISYTTPTRTPKEVIPPEEAYAEELAAWNAGHQSERRLASALGIGESQARARIRSMRAAGLIQTQPCPNHAYWQGRRAAVGA